MNNFMHILSQLFWGVTIGALGAAFAYIAKGIALALFAVCGGCMFLRRERIRAWLANRRSD